MKTSKSVSQIVAAHVLTYFNFLNLVLFVLILISGQYKNMLFMGIVISNALIGIIQELRVKKMIDKLAVLTATKARLLLSGEVGAEIDDAAYREVPIEELRVDDIIYLITGDQIPCDSTVITSDGLEVDESMLTGESVPVHKVAGDELFSGSYVVAGSGAVCIVHTGENNYAAKLVEKARTKKRASSEMQYAINRIIHYVSYALVPIGLALFAIQYFRVHAGLSDSLVNTVAGVLGMIPEGLVLLTSISFILGVGRLAGKRALVQEMEAIEALARVDTLCLDKTGTITTGALKVEREIFLFEKESILNMPAEIEAGYEETEITSNTGIEDQGLSGDDGEKTRKLRSIMDGIAYAFTDTNVTGEALKAYYQDTKPDEIVDTLPFSSRRKYMGVDFRNLGCYVLGAPDFLTKNEEILHKSEEYATRGFRVLLLAQVNCLADTAKELTNVKPCMLVVLSDTVKEDAPETLRFFKDMGVKIRILSGDNPATVSAVAVAAGLEGGEQYVDATTLPDDEDALRREAAKYTVFGRVSPERKHELIRAFQKGDKKENNDKKGKIKTLINKLKWGRKHEEQAAVVGMVGDGVNDVLALKEADCSIAMANGADAARQTAHIVLTDSNFSSMKNIVSEGRTIIANIERVSALYLTKTIYSVLLCVIFIIIGRNYPFIPIQLSLIGATAIGIPSFLLALEHHEEPIISGFLEHVMKISMPGAVAMVVGLAGVQIFDKVFEPGVMVVSTLNMFIGGAVSLCVLVFVCHPMNKMRLVMCIAMTAIFVGACIVAPNFFGILSIF